MSASPRCVIGGLPLVLIALSCAWCSAAVLEPVEMRDVAPGIAYLRFVVEEGRGSVAHVLRLQRGDHGLLVDMVSADGFHEGCATVSELQAGAQRPGMTALAAINAGFFSMPGCAPVGASGGDGRVWTEDTKRWVKVGITGDLALRTSDSLNLDAVMHLDDNSTVNIRLNRPIVANRAIVLTQDYADGIQRIPCARAALLEANEPLLGLAPVHARVTQVIDGVFEGPIPTGGAVLAATGSAEQALKDVWKPGARVRLDPQMDDETWHDVRCYVMGAGWLVHAGEIAEGKWGRYRKDFKGPHPRTAIGGNERYLYLVAVDGRQPGHSLGMGFAELAGFMKHALDCIEAVNLDGGGSTAMVIEGELVSCPSEQALPPCSGRERRVSNALVVFVPVAP